MTIDEVIAKLNKEYGQTLVRRGVTYEDIDRIPFSSARVNWMTYGGIPRVRVTELFGPESGGKTTTALDLVKNAQRLAREEWEQKKRAVDALPDTKKTNKADLLADLEQRGPRRVLYVDTEGTFDGEWAKRLGVAVDDLFVVVPWEQSAEQVLQIILDLIDTGDVYFAVLDSVPMLVSGNMVDESLEKKEYGGISQTMTAFCRKLVPRLTHHETTFLFINQVRDDLGNMYNSYKTPGGRMLKHVASLRIFVRRGKFLDDENRELTNAGAERPAGNVIELQLMKTKVCPPSRRVGSYTLKYQTGIDTVEDLLATALAESLITRAAMRYAWVVDGEERVVLGKDNLRRYLEEHPDECAWLEQQLAHVT